MYSKIYSEINLKKQLSRNQCKKSPNLKLDKKTVAEFLPNTKSFEISSKVGATVNEIIKNVFGKNSNITPHTYDISKEFDSIAIQRNHGGYKDGIATTKGTTGGI